MLCLERVFSICYVKMSHYILIKRDIAMPSLLYGIYFMIFTFYIPFLKEQLISIDLLVYNIIFSHTLYLPTQGKEFIGFVNAEGVSVAALT